MQSPPAVAVLVELINPSQGALRRFSTPHYLLLRIMQSIFSPAPRRNPQERQRDPGRRGGGLKMGWTKPRGVSRLWVLNHGEAVDTGKESVGGGFRRRGKQ